MKNPIDHYLSRYIDHLKQDFQTAFAKQDVFALSSLNYDLVSAYVVKIDVGMRPEKYFNLEKYLTLSNPA